MTTAAEQALERLGLQDHQALFVAHNDTDHPHLHVLVNKTHPETGRVVNPHRDYNKLDKWAREYRQERGQEHYCPNREKKWQNHDEGQSNANRQKQTAAKLERGESATLNANDPRAADLRNEFAQEGDRLSQQAKDMKAEHSQQWERFKAKNKAEKSAIYDRYKQPMQDARARLAVNKAAHGAIKDVYKAKIADRMKRIEERYQPQRREVGRAKWKAERAYEAHENSLTGRLGHAISAAIHNRQQNPQQSQGFVADTVRMFMNTSDRRAAFDEMNEQKWTPLNQAINAEKRAARSELWAEQKEALAPAKEATGAAVQDMKPMNNHRAGELESYKLAENTRYEDLKLNQATDRKQMQELWGALKKRRAEGIRGLKAKMREKLEQRHAHNQAFKEAAKDEAEKVTRTRNRSKERKPRNRGRTRKYDRE
jgi:hypothetical protein